MYSWILSKKKKRLKQGVYVREVSKGCSFRDHVERILGEDLHDLARASFHKPWACIRQNRHDGDQKERLHPSSFLECLFAFASL